MKCKVVERKQWHKVCRSACSTKQQIKKHIICSVSLTSEIKTALVTIVLAIFSSLDGRKWSYTAYATKAYCFFCLLTCARLCRKARSLVQLWKKHSLWKQEVYVQAAHLGSSYLDSDHLLSQLSSHVETVFYEWLDYNWLLVDATTKKKKKMSSQPISLKHIISLTINCNPLSDSSLYSFLCIQCLDYHPAQESFISSLMLSNCYDTLHTSHWLKQA